MTAPNSAPKPRGWRSRPVTKAKGRVLVDSAQMGLLEALPAIPPSRDLDALLSRDEATHRRRTLDTPGRLRRAMQLLESTAIGDAWSAEAWRWITSMQIVQGHNPNSTCARYVDTLRRFANWLLESAPTADYRVIGTPEIEAWLKALMITRGNQASWRKTQLAALRAFYDWRHRAGLGLNCAAAVRGPRRTQRVPRKYTVAQLQALFAAVKTSGAEITRDRDRILLLFLLATGARCEEAGTLRLDQIDIAEKTGRVRFLGKGSKERTVGIEGPIVSDLQRWIVLRDQIPQLGDTVFWSTHPTHWGMPLSASGIEGIVRRYARAAGLGTWGVHRFRVTYATGLYDDGVDIERIRLLLGHESIETTRGYLAVSERQASTRMRASRQYQALGEDPPGTPRWLKAKQDRMKGKTDAPF